MSDGRYTVWVNLSCFQKSFPLGAACFDPDLAYCEKEERKLIGFINQDIHPGRSKRKLFISSQRRFSAKKYWKWILGNGTILYSTCAMTALCSGCSTTGLQSLYENFYRHGKGGSGTEWLGTSWCRGDERVKGESEEENKEENTLWALRCVLVLVILLMLSCAISVSGERMYLCKFRWRAEYVSWQIQVLQRNDCRELSGKQRFSPSHFSHSSEVSHLAA